MIFARDVTGPLTSLVKKIDEATAKNSDANMGSAFNSLAISNATLEATASFASGRAVTLNGPATFSVAGAGTTA